MKKQKIGTVIYSDEYSAKVKINKNNNYDFYYNCQRNKIITVNNEIGAKLGQDVYIEFDILKKAKLIYIYYIQPIILGIIGIIIADFVKENLDQFSIIYNHMFAIMFFTVGMIYKDYHKEKNKYNKKNSPNITKILE